MRVEQNPQISDFERHLLAFILAGDDPLLQALTAQLDAARVTTRELSGVGFFLNFSVPSSLALRDPSSFEIDDVNFELEELENPAGSILFVREGVLSTLEGYSYDGSPWPSEPRVRRVYYDSGGQRDLAMLGKVWREGRKPSAP